MNITYTKGWTKWIKMLRDFQEGKFYQEIKIDLIKYPDRVKNFDITPKDWGQKKWYQKLLADRVESKRVQFTLKCLCCNGNASIKSKRIPGGTIILKDKTLLLCKDCKEALLRDLWIINEFPGKDDTGVTVEMLLPVDMYRLAQRYMCGIPPAYEIGTAMVIKAFDNGYLDKAEKWLQYTWKLLQRGDACCCTNAQSLGELAIAISCQDISRRIKLNTHCNSFGRIVPPLSISQDLDENKKQSVLETYRDDTWRKFRGFLT